MTLELFVLPWGIYPRRVLIYLSEKGLLDSPRLKITPVTIIPGGNRVEAPGKPPGSVPILCLESGEHVSQSIAIVEYFEDLCDSGSDIASDDAIRATMRGGTAAERARTREILALTDEASTHFGVACHKGAVLFASLEVQDPKASQFALEACKKSLGLIEPYYEDVEERLGRGKVTIADCVLFALIEFAEGFNGKNLVVGLKNLGLFYECFGRRASAKIDEGFYPAAFKSLASDWNW